MYMNATVTAIFGKLIFGTAFFFAALTANTGVSATPAADARTSATPVSATTRPSADSAVIKYLGIQDDMLLFNVSYNNPYGSVFSIIIKDQEGSSLYKGSFRDKAFFKQFRVPNTDKQRITFVIRNAGDADMVRSFEVNHNSHFVEDVAIKKLK